jgi:O-antigen/teichoic acid export membrane protein
LANEPEGHGWERANGFQAAGGSNLAAKTGMSVASQAIGEPGAASVADSASDAPATRKGARAYFAATVVSQVGALVRYAILSRLLGPSQLGLAATIILTAAFFESVSDSGGDRFLIQSREGDSPRVQGLVQLMLTIRGGGVAALLVLLAWPLAALYGTPPLMAGMMVLAISPLIGGFIHLDMRRMQRHNDFRAESVNVIVCEVVMTTVTTVAAYFLRNYTAILYGIIARSLSTVIISHIMARRPYQLAFSAPHVKTLAAFAWPLMINGSLLFLGGQGDRVFVGSRLGPTELGLYSVVTLLAYYPTMTLGRYMSGVHLPKIAAGRLLPANADDSVDVLEGQTILLAIIMMVGFAFTAPLATIVLFGARFAQSGLVVSLIGALQMCRFVRLWPTTVALAYGRSGVIMTTNLIRLVAFPAAFVMSSLFGGIAAIALGFILGELLAQAVGLAMISQDSRIPVSRGVNRMLVFAAATAVVILWELALIHPVALVLATLSLATIAVGAWLLRVETGTIRASYRTLAQLARRSQLSHAPTRH